MRRVRQFSEGATRTDLDGATLEHATVQIAIHYNTPERLISMEIGYYLMVASAALAPDVRTRATGALGAVAGGLAIAGLRAGPAPAILDPGFVAADVALLLVGALLGSIAAVIGWRHGRSPLARGGSIGLLAGAGAMIWGGAGLLAAAAPASVVLALLVVSGAGLILLIPGRLKRHGGDSDLAGTPPRPVAGVAGVVAGTVAAAAGPHLSVVFLGVIVAGWAGYLVQRAAGGSKVPAAPALTLILLPAWWLMATIAGPEGLSLGSLGTLPFSPAAERLLAPALLLAAWVLAGLWPFHRQMPGPLTAPVGAFLLARVALVAVPDGLEHWRALAMPVVVAGIWHAALTGRLALLAVGLGWVALLAPGGEGLTGAALLLAAALLLELGRPIGRADPRRAAALRLVVGLVAGGGGLLAIEAALHGEVVYTVLAIGGVVAAAGRVVAAQASTASDPRTTAPSA